jgi:glycosyltransferase involved in cell wall biosynthesis
MSSLDSLRIRLRAQYTGWPARQRLVWEAIALLRAALCLWGGPKHPRYHAWLAEACRRTSLQSLRNFLQPRVSALLSGPQASIWREQKVGWEPYLADMARFPANEISASILLKAPQENGEKGVLYSSFEYNWLKLAQHPKAKEFFARYTLVGASSWSPGNFGVMASMAGLSDSPVFLGVSNASDLDGYRMLSPVIDPVMQLASDWIHPGYYRPKPRQERSIDILMVANWLPFKRHWLLFEALRSLPSHLRVVLIGIAAPGRTEQVLRAEAEAFGVTQKIEFHTNLSIDEVTGFQCDAKLAVVMSHREGSCVVVAESLFADTPVILMEDAVIGSKAYINPQTGALANRSNFPQQIERLLATNPALAPRDWAIKHISCLISSARLNEILRNRSQQEGRPWTTDIAPLCWRHMPRHVDPAEGERLEQARLLLASELGINVHPAARSELLP